MDPNAARKNCNLTYVEGKSILQNLWRRHISTGGGLMECTNVYQPNLHANPYHFNTSKVFGIGATG